MTKQSFEKSLTANDTGESGTHQAGIHIPKREYELIQFLPYLDPAVKNPDAWIDFWDDFGRSWKFRYIYYNNKLHDKTGTRNEYRLTHTTRFFQSVGARSGDTLTLTKCDATGRYLISVASPVPEVSDCEVRGSTSVRLRGWRRVH